jgi:PKHD-type hydroxylase
MLFDPENAKRGLFAKSGKTPEFDLVAKTGASLFRMRAEV